MKIRDLLAKLKYENPEAEVVPIGDDSGSVALTVLLPDRLPDDVSMLGNEEARNLLGGHLERIEKIRVAIGAFYGLPVVFSCRSDPHGYDSVEMRVKSPTGQTMVSLIIRIDYVLIKDGYNWRQERNEQTWTSDGMVRVSRIFKDVLPEIAGYSLNISKYVLTRDKLEEAMRDLCDAPKWIEHVAERA